MSGYTSKSHSPIEHASSTYAGGVQTDQALFRDMVEALAERGVPVARVVLVDKSSFPTLPPGSVMTTPASVLYLYVSNAEQLQHHGAADGPVVMEASWEHARWVREKWTELCKLHGLSDWYDSPGMYICIDVQVDPRIVSFVYDSKPAIIQEVHRVCRERGRKLPSSIYASSHPGVSIVFPCPWHLKRVRKDGTDRALCEAIDALLGRLDRHGCYKRRYVRIEFYDSFMCPNGLYRED